MICSLAVRARPKLLCLVAKSKAFQPEVWMSLVPAEKGVSNCQGAFWHHTATSFAVAIVNCQSKLGVDKGSFAGLW